MRPHDTVSNIGEKSSTTPTIWLVAILLAAAALRLVPIWFGIPYLPARPDEEVAVSIATRVTEGEWNPRFFHWPSFTFYLFAAVYAAASLVRRVFGVDAAMTVIDRVVLARAVVALAGTLTVFVLYRLGRRIIDNTTGLFAAAFLTVAILHVRDSHFAMTDVLMTLLLTASLALLVRAVDSSLAGETALRGFALAGVAAGLAASTKYNAAALVGAMGAAHFVLVFQRREAGTARTWMAALSFTAAFIASFLAGSPYAVLDFKQFEADLRFDFTHLSGGHGLDLGRGWRYHLERSLPYGVGLPIFVAACVGVVPTIRRHARHAFILGGFALPFYLAIGSGATVFFRYVMPLVPIVCLLAAAGIRYLTPWLSARTRVPATAVMTTLLLLTAGPGLVNCAWFDAVLARTDTRVLAAAWLRPQLKPEHTLHDTGGDYTKLDLRHQRFHEWPFDPNRNSFGHPDGHTPDWLVLTESPLRLYASIPPQLRQLAQEKYTLVYTAAATRGRARAAVYDLQDAFFMPLSRLDTVVRPGPTIRIYRRND
jgi:4-amino-4-deoxy-L-arabinose transferase-like glycosyltransferase